MMVEAVVTRTDELVDKSLARKFNEVDWACWSGASELPDGSGPFISIDDKYVVILSGPTDGYSDEGEDSGIQITYLTDKDEVVCWNQDLWYFEKYREGYVRLFNSFCRMMKDSDITDKIVDSFCIACNFDRII